MLAFIEDDSTKNENLEVYLKERESDVEAIRKAVKGDGHKCQIVHTTLDNFFRFKEKVVSY